MRPNLYDLTLPEMTDFILQLGQPKYRAKQIWQWLYKKYALDFENMTSLPYALREQLQASATLNPLQIALEQDSNDGQTKKLLFKLPDGQLIETVLMTYEKRRTICISTQAGCAMGCVFCATGQMGFYRNLSVGEIVSQVVYFCHHLAAQGDHLTNVVMMGMGEPLHNYANTMTALDRMTDATGINLGARKITISTVGLVPAIRRYADERRQTPLAISLHVATNAERTTLLPINKRWSLDDLMAACDYYVEQTGRRLTFEWALINGQNDTIAQADALGTLLQGKLCHVNLIPLNPTGGFAGGPSSRDNTSAFQAHLSEYGVSSTVRVRRGIDIQAGCGQLRDRMIGEAYMEAGIKFFEPGTNDPI